MRTYLKSWVVFYIPIVTIQHLTQNLGISRHRKRMHKMSFSKLLIILHIFSFFLMNNYMDFFKTVPEYFIAIHLIYNY